MSLPTSPLDPISENKKGERALRDLRSLWPVPTLALAAVVGLLSLAGHSIPSLLLTALWAALAVFVLTFIIYNRRALSLAALLQAHAKEASASHHRLSVLNQELESLAAANSELYAASCTAASSLRLLAERVAEAIASTGDIHRVTAPVAEQAVALFACDGAGIYLASDDGRALIPIAYEPILPERQNLRIDSPLLEESLWAASVPFTFADARVLGPGWEGWRTTILAPMRGRGQRLLGALVLHWQTKKAVDEEMLGLANALASFAAVAVENTRYAEAALVDRQSLTERNAQLLEETNRRSQDLRALVRRVGDALTAGHSSGRVARLVAEQALQMIPCRHVVFSVTEEGGPAEPPALVPIALAGDSPSGWENGGWSVSDFPFLESVLLRPHPVFLADVASDERLTLRERAALRRADITTLLLAPMHGRGERTVGLLSLFWSETGLNPTPEEFETAGVLAAQAASALENARLYRDLEITEGQLKTQLASAQAARDFVEGVLQNTPAAVLVLNTGPELTVQSANALAEAMPDLPYRLDGLAGRNLAEIFPGMDGLLNQAMQAARQGEASSLADLEYHGFERGVTYWTFSVTPQRDNATRRVSQIILLALETSERIRLLRENEENARREQQRANELDATLRSLADGVVTCDAQGRLLSVNRAGQAILSSSAFSPEERVEAWAARIGLCYPSGQKVPAGAVPLIRALRMNQAMEAEEYSICTETGVRRLIELTATPVFAPAASVVDETTDITGAVAVFRDITALRHSQSQETAANRRVETLIGISRRLNATQELDEINLAVTEGAHALLPEIPDLQVLLYDLEAETRALHLRAMWPEPPASRSPLGRRGTPHFTLPFDAASPVFWQIYISRQPLISHDLARDKQFSDPVQKRHLAGGEAVSSPRSALILPLTARETVSGHLLLTSSQEAAFADPRLADALTNLTALAVISRANARLYQQTKQRVEELNALWTVGEATASQLELADVVDTLTDQVRQVMGGEACTLTLYQNTGRGRALARQGSAWRNWALLNAAEGEFPLCDACDLVTQEAALSGEPVCQIGQRNPDFPSCRWRAFSGQSGEHSILAVPLRSGEESLGALTVWVSGGRPFAPDKIKLLGTLATLAVAAVRNAQSFAYEQNIAETLQNAFLPGEPTQQQGLDIAEKYYPTFINEARIGGDYYEFIRLSSEKLAVVIGDISGKGLAAAVYTAMAKYTVRAFAAQGMTPREVVTRSNTAIVRHTTGEIFSTLFYGVIDTEAHTLTYVSAGHEPPLLARPDGTLSLLLPTGTMLGAFADMVWDEETVPFHAGDTIALFTDGLPDARAADGCFFGEAGVRAVLEANRSRSASVICDALHAAVIQFAAESGLRDDIALLVLKAI